MEYGNMKDAISEARQIINTAKARRQRLIDEKTELEASVKNGYRLAQELVWTDIKAFHSVLDETTENSARLRTIEAKLEKVSLFEDEEIKALREIKSSIKKIVKNKDSELGDIYYSMWIQAEKVERELQKAINDGRNICNEIDRNLGIQTVNDLSSIYTGMLMPSQDGIKFVSAWQRFNKRKNKG